MTDSPTLQFLDFQKPALKSDTYEITVAQTIEAGSESESFQSPPTFFAALGERFSMDPLSIHAVFPPSGSLGDHSNCLPHMALKRGTFPWERSAYGEDDAEPWLALLLVDESELVNGSVRQSVISLQELLDSSRQNALKFPDITLETRQLSKDRVSVIDVRKSLLDEIMPNGEELKLLAHVRRIVNGDPDKAETDLAVIVGNRLPRSGADSTVFLISVEGRYKPDKTFDFQNAADGAMVRLVVLNSWSFACLADEGMVFEELIRNLSSGPLRLPNPGMSPAALEDKQKFPAFMAESTTQRTDLGLEYTPWLALLLFDEAEFVDGSVTESITQLQDLRTDFPYVLPEKIRAAEDASSHNPNITVIDVKKGLCELVIQPATGLRYMTQVMRRVMNGDLTAASDIVIFGNRVPGKESTCTVYLVSLEDRYKADGLFDYGDAGSSQMIRLVTLGKWNYTQMIEEDNIYNDLRSAVDEWSQTTSSED